MIGKLKNKVVALVLLCFISSCQDLDKTERPDNLIPEDKMIDILTELSLLHAAKNYNKYKLEQTGIKTDVYVYEKFDVDSIQVQRSNDYYSDQYEEYERIYDSVRARIQIMKMHFDSIRDVEIRIEDSIKKVKKDSLKLRDSLMLDPVKADSLRRDSIRLNILKEAKNLKVDSLILPPAALEQEN